MVKKILSIILWVITGAALIVLFVFGRNWYLETPLKGIKLSLERSHINGFVDQDTMLANAAAVCDLAHQNKITNVDMKRINKLLADNPWIENGSAYIGLNDTLTIKAKEYEPVLRVYGNDGRSVYVTAEGKIIPSSPRYTPHLIIASGNFSLPMPQRNACVNDTLFGSTGIAEALILSQTIVRDDYLAEHVGQIYRNQEGEFELTVNNLPPKVIVGDIDNINHKMSRLRVLLEKYNNTEELINFKTLDLRYKNQIVCTK